MTDDRARAVDPSHLHVRQPGNPPQAITPSRAALLALVNTSDDDRGLGPPVDLEG
jgi:hypothetical protein